jgi:hypothetical protein
MYPNVVSSPLVDAPGLDSLSIISGGGSSQKWRGRSGRHGGHSMRGKSVSRSTGRRVMRGSKRVQRTNGQRTNGRRPKVRKSKRRR